MLMRFVALAVLVALVPSSFSAQVAAGEIAGQITDPSGAGLPGVKITVRGNDQMREAVTDNDGRFRVGSLPLSTYQVTTALPGFITLNATMTLSPTSRAALIAWPMRVACIAEPIVVIAPVRDAARDADLIAEVRIEAVSGEVQWFDSPECARRLHHYEARIAAPVSGPKGRIAAGTRIDILTPARAPLLLRDHGYVALLSQMPRSSQFWHAHHNLVLPVVDGRVVDPSTSDLHGRTVRDVLDTLRKWAAEKRR